MRILEQQVVGKNYLKLSLSQDHGKIGAIAWRWGDYFPLPSSVDIAYKLRENRWQGNTSVELELVGVRLPTTPTPKKAKFDYQGRSYTCSLWDSLNELRIKNAQGKVLAVHRGKSIGLLGTSRDNAKKVNVTEPPYYQLIKAAIAALEKVNSH